MTVSAVALTNENENMGGPHPQELTSRLHHVIWGTPHYPLLITLC